MLNRHIISLFSLSKVFIPCNNPALGPASCTHVTFFHMKRPNLHMHRKLVKTKQLYEANCLTLLRPFPIFRINVLPRSSEESGSGGEVNFSLPVVVLAVVLFQRGLALLHYWYGFVCLSLGDVDCS